MLFQSGYLKVYLAFCLSKKEAVESIALGFANLGEKVNLRNSSSSWAYFSILSFFM